MDWYAYHPSAADYDVLRQSIGQYLSVFRERTPEREQAGPKLVFICAPLRGEWKPILNSHGRRHGRCLRMEISPFAHTCCFPPIADPNNPEQDAKAREMSRSFWDPCQQLNVYGPIWTEGMWDEFHHASKLGIPMMTDQKAIGRMPPARHPAERSDNAGTGTQKGRPALLSGRTAIFSISSVLQAGHCGKTV